MSRCLCAVCKQLFEQPGAMLFTAPDAEGLRTEFHICPPCSDKITSGKQQHAPDKKQRYPGFPRPAKCICCLADFLLPGALFATVPDKSIRCRIVHICPACQNVILNVSHTKPV